MTGSPATVPDTEHPGLIGLLPARLLAVGGIFYTTGVIFHVWDSLRFQNAIWHAFVLVATACHYGAVVSFVAGSPAA